MSKKLTDQSASTAASSKSFSPRPFVFAGYTTIFLAFGVLGGWAMIAPLDSAIIASGTLSVESSRKIVQHYEGGIVKEILVKEAERVKKGDVLVRLNPIQAQANLSMVNTRLEIAQAEAARLIAERSNSEVVAFPSVLTSSNDPRVKFAIQGQKNLFLDRMSVRNSQIKILESKIIQLKGQVSGLEQQRDAAQMEIDLIKAEVERLVEGEGKGVVSTNRLSSLKREQAKLSGSFGRLTSEIARTNEAIGETELEIVRVKQQFSERAATELKEVRDQLAELEERAVVAGDVFSRTDIQADVDGVVQNVKVHTIGGVIKPGEPIMEIVPVDDEIVISARLRPIDIDSVAAGMEAEVKLSAFADRYLPSVFGKIAYLSPDILLSEDAQREPYYLARVVVEESEVPDQIRGKLVPGMPAEVIIPTGERTVAEYLISPLENALRKSLREE